MSKKITFKACQSTRLGPYLDVVRPIPRLDWFRDFNIVLLVIQFNGYTEVKTLTQGPEFRM